MSLLPTLKIGARERLAGELESCQHILAFLDGHHDLDDIAQGSGLTPSGVEALINHLHRIGALDLRKSAIQVSDRHLSKVRARAMASKRSIPDEVARQLQVKIAPELTLLTWRPDVDDGGVEMLSARREFEVEVGGRSRAMASFLQILSASGVTNTRLSLSDRGDRHLVACDDVIGNGLSLSDIGKGYIATLQERVKSVALFSHVEESDKARPFLRVYFGTPSLEQSSQWEQRGENYCIVPEPSAARATIGPLVIPQKTPCFRCAELSRGVRESIDGYVLPVAQAHLIAALLADQVLRFIDTGGCEIVGAQVEMDFLSPLDLHHAQLSYHPRCGCSFH